MPDNYVLYADVKIYTHTHARTHTHTHTRTRLFYDPRDCLGLTGIGSTSYYSLVLFHF